VEGEPSSQSVEEVAQGVAAADWRVLTVAEDAQGPRRCQFAAQRVWEGREGLLGRECWLLLRRLPALPAAGRRQAGNLDGSELKYYLSNAPADTLLSQLAHVGSLRWCIETDLQTSKGEAGLDEYEVRSWQGWHHHMVLAMLAAVFLLTLRLEWGEKDAPDYAAAGLPAAGRSVACCVSCCRDEPGQRRSYFAGSSRRKSAMSAPNALMRNVVPRNGRN